MPALPDFEVKPVSVEEGKVTWYDVPERSLARRRAWPGELTAASDRLPKESYVRVRRIDTKGDQDKTVVGRITDNGVHQRGTLIDLCREAAEALGMVEAGEVRVRVETLALQNATTDKPVEKKSDPPLTPKASEITDQPTANAQQEKDAAKTNSVRKTMAYKSRRPPSGRFPVAPKGVSSSGVSAGGSGRTASRY